MAKIISNIQTERLITKSVEEWAQDPFKFVMEVYPWGQKGTPLARHEAPREWQANALYDLADFIMDNQSLAANGKEISTPVFRFARASGRGIGKALDLDDEVPTPTGWRRWGDLDVGDKLFGVNGRPTNILATHHHANLKMHRVHFDDGSYTDCCEDHQWTLRTIKRPKTVTLTTKEMAARPRAGSRGDRRWSLPLVKPVQYPTQVLPIEPYLLGVWLGDGTTASGSITCPDLYGDNNSHTVEGLHTALRKSGLLGNKHVPPQYLIGDVSQRKALLQGLLDTDGTPNVNSATFDNTLEHLVDDVVELARSLGLKARRNKTKARPYYRDETGAKVYCKPCHRATVTYNGEFPLFRLCRKQDQLTAPTQDRYLRRFVDDVTPIPNASGMCVTVDAQDSLFLCNDYVPTHNSAYLSWLAHWTKSCILGSSTIVSANGEPQLKGATFPEIKRWVTMGVNSYLFETTALSITPTKMYKDLLQEQLKLDTSYHYILAKLWSEENPNAFAGIHNQYGTTVLFDEASGIPQSIQSVTEGFFTDITPHRMWIQFSNPREVDTAFHGLFADPAWNTSAISSLDVEGLDHSVYHNIIRKYGADSDEARVEVYGQFPRSGARNFISAELVSQAAQRPATHDRTAPTIVGVDPARFGDDSTVISIRRGMDAKTIPPREFKGLDTMQTANEVAKVINQYNPQAVFVDEVGVGAGVVDRLRQLNFRVVGVNSGATPDDKKHYRNKRIEMADRMKSWLNTAAIHMDYSSELSLPEYSYDAVGKMQLESKEDMKKRGHDSPNFFDSLSYTFAQQVGRLDWQEIPETQYRAVTDYDEFEY